MSDPAQHLQVAKAAADTISAAAILGALVNVLPPLAALGAVIWYSIQIYESHTVQTFLHKHRVVKRYRHRRRHRHAHEPWRPL